MLEIRVHSLTRLLERFKSFFLLLLWGLSLFPVFCTPYIRHSFPEPCRSSLVLLKLLKCWDKEHGLKPYSSDLNRFYRRSCSAWGSDHMRKTSGRGERRQTLPSSFAGSRMKYGRLAPSAFVGRSESHRCQVLHNSVQTGCSLVCQELTPRHFVRRRRDSCGRFCQSCLSERSVVLPAQKGEDNEEWWSGVQLSVVQTFMFTWLATGGGPWISHLAHQYTS